MSDKSAFDIKNFETIDIERKRDVLDELNLPPGVASFLRKNKRNIKIAVVVITVVVFGWVFLDHYAETRRDESVALLAKALKEKPGAAKDLLMADLLSDYGGTDAALLGRLETANTAFDDKRFQDAIKGYHEVLKDVAANNPLIPVLQYGLAYAYECNDEPDKALTHFTNLSEMPGFKSEGLLAMGRIYENKGAFDKAKEIYEKYLALKDTLALSETAWVEDRLGKLNDE
ncbi:MAG: tetratricopeptide repeat protein [Thermodesulfobacteriota bacterium]|nr:tetratricopeptide repeat protein [Thermodesulfobacteriota bacterium]